MVEVISRGLILVKSYKLLEPGQILEMVCNINRTHIYGVRMIRHSRYFGQFKVDLLSRLVSKAHQKV